MNKHLKIMILSILGLFAVFCLPFWKPLSLAAIFSLGIHPSLCKWYKTKNIPMRVAVLAGTAVTLVIIIPFALGIYGLSEQMVELAKNNGNQPIKSLSLQKIINKFESFSDIKLSFIDKSSKAIAKVGDSISQYFFDLSMEIIKGVPDFTLEFIVFALALYIFLYHGTHIKEKIIHSKLLNKKDMDELAEVLQKSSYECLVVLIVVGGIQAVIVTIGAAIASFGSLFLVFLVTFLVSFIPIIGAAPVAFCLALFKFISGDVTMGIVLVAIGCIAGTIDNILKPMFVTKGIEIDGAVSLIAIIGAIAVFGLPGLLIGPVMSCTAAHYFKKITE